jgi:hypothetical protein
MKTDYKDILDMIEKLFDVSSINRISPKWYEVNISRVHKVQVLFNNYGILIICFSDYIRKYMKQFRDDKLSNIFTIVA